MKDPKLAFKRRGAHWTFDAHSFCKMVSKIVSTTSEPIKAPLFNHADKDPIFDALEILPQHTICIIEGLYVHLDIPPWNTIQNLYSLKFHLEADLKIIQDRVVQRAVSEGICSTQDDALLRFLESDYLNGQFLCKHLNSSNSNPIIVINLEKE